jgi:molybdopterin-guanine dinucleotide biosynthesis protein A
VAGLSDELGVFVQAAGFLLAGGQSLRMRSDKALLQLGGRSLVERGLETLRAVCAEVAILSNNPELQRFGRVIPDAVPGCGPLGGIVAALESSEFEWNLVLAVDLPFLPVAALKMLLFAAATSQSVAIIPEVDGQPQPLCALYAKTAAPVLRQELEAGYWKVTAAIRAAGEVTFAPFHQAEWFRNLNTPEDFAEAERSSGGLDG